MPGGNTFVVGAGTSTDIAPAPCTTQRPAPTALYDYAAGKWVNGPAIPTIGGLQYDSADGPGSILPDGNVLFDVSPCVYNAPIAFFLYNASSNTLSPVPNVPNAANDSTYYTRMLALPNGQVLFNDGSNQMLVYTAGGNAQPGVGSVDQLDQHHDLEPGHRPPACRAPSSPGSPRARPTVTTCRTTPTSRWCGSRTRSPGWSPTPGRATGRSVSIAPGAASSTDFTIPKTTPAGASTLVVIANGIASAPVPVTIR